MVLIGIKLATIMRISVDDISMEVTSIIPRVCFSLVHLGLWFSRWIAQNIILFAIGVNLVWEINNICNNWINLSLQFNELFYAWLDNSKNHNELTSLISVNSHCTSHGLTMIKMLDQILILSPILFLWVGWGDISQ